MRGYAVILAATLAWFISNKSAEAKLDILVDKATQRMLVIQDGYIRFMWPVSTGRDATQTPNGVYSPQRLERNWSSTAYYDSPMPFSIFFYNGYAIHGSYAIDRLGGPASHGCVRLHPHHAAILFDLVQQEGPSRTSIEITDQGRPEPALLRREMAAGSGVNQPLPRKVRYPVPGDMANLPPAQRNRLIAARNALPPKPAPPADRRLLADVRPPANALRAPRGLGEAEITIGASRSQNESSDSRSKPKLAEGPKVVEGSVPEPASSNSGIKVLPTSCWTGGASRWKWWASGQGNPCK
jgi:L,D-transpeptidase-like protein